MAKNIHFVETFSQPFVLSNLLLEMLHLMIFLCLISLCLTNKTPWLFWVLQQKKVEKSLTDFQSPRSDNVHLAISPWPMFMMKMMCDCFFYTAGHRYMVFSLVCIILFSYHSEI